MTNASRQPIGIFDSGIGGLTIAEKIVKDFPQENIVYFGDTAHLPYGDKSEELIRHYCLGISRFLLEKQCKLIIIACNSASSVAFDYLVSELGNQVHFINVVEPVVKGISEMPDIKSIGIIGTQRTISSGIYADRLKSLRPDIQTHSLATPLLAPMIEAGFFNNQISEVVIETYLNDPQLKSIEALVLACTHYPLIKEQILKFYNGKAQVFDSTDFISKEVGTVLAQNGLLNDNKTTKNHFYVSDLTESFEKTTRLFFQDEIELEYHPLWESKSHVID